MTGETTGFDVDALRQRVGPRDLAAGDAARTRLDALLKPTGSLGRLEPLAAWLAGAQGVCPPRPLEQVRVVVFAGDHGIARHGVSAYPAEVTAGMVGAFLAGTAGVSVLARAAGAGVRVLDLAVDAEPGAHDWPADVTRWKVRRSSGSIDREDALDDAELDAALAAGVAVADEEVDAGADLLIAGDMGIGNTTVAAALVGAVLGLGPLDVVGTGTGVDDAAWARKVAGLRDALYRARAYHDPLHLLRVVGSADIAATVGFLAQAAARRTPVLLDGVVSCAAALLATRLVEGCGQWFVASHRSTEPSQHRALEALGLEPLVDLQLRLGEGTGALTALPLLRAAQALLAEMGTLDSLRLPSPVDSDAT